MQFNVSQLLKSSVGATREYDISEQASVLEDVEVVSPFDGHVKLTRTPQGILVKATLVTTLALSCSRCLEPMTYSLEIGFEEEFDPTVDVLTGIELPAPDDSNIFTLDENHILDLTPAVREYAVLALPMQPLCRIDCAGLCHRCGHDLNSGKCGCAAGTVDSRLLVLQSLLEEKPDEG